MMGKKLWMFELRYRMHVRRCKYPMAFEDWKRLIIDCNYTVPRQVKAVLWGKFWITVQRIQRVIEDV